MAAYKKIHYTRALHCDWRKPSSMLLFNSYYFAEAKGYILWFLADRQSRLLFWTIALRILVQNNKNDSQNVSGLFYTTIISKLLIIVNLHVNALLLLYGFLTPLLLYSTVKS